MQTVSTKSSVKNYGEIITFCKTDFNCTGKYFCKDCRKISTRFIHPYDNYKVIAGQARYAKKIYEKLNYLNFLVTLAVVLNNRKLFYDKKSG